MKTSVYNKDGKETGKDIELKDSIFGIEPNDHAIYLDCKQYMANRRQGTHKAKERSEVAGSTRKIKRQKGTGTARFGDIKNPLFRGGGRVFGPQPRDYSFKLNKKVKRLARKSALSYKASESNILIVDNLNYDQIKTKNIISLRTNFKVENKKVLLVVNESNKNIYLSSRNLKNVKTISASNLNTYDIVWASKIIFEQDSIDVLEKIFE
ncbi:MAG TPA: 50S ribosomal protein L4 [Bacteroidales bacterium]|jgi:large subunit ribosomal protein L4|nr:50S ribosomal protein L4 [Bacteroidales bacterium]MDD4235477.1 50S ribosomal protein L4 [Bacteroidales bacterium]MDY0160440.1 50S ribosomal protein L4 [Bacteroidales bacterium]HRW20443.1 50S ribosomal protein L4 [Bacteroidales bacterium]HXK81857.1 50S ribosomal protein L4 [Bacteroidales bacterium]